MIDADYINRNIPIKEIAQFLGLGEMNETNFVSCPKHVDKTPSLRLYPDTNTWHCFGCLNGYTVIDLYMFVTGKSFRNSFEEICELYGLDYEAKSEDAKAEIRKLQEKQERERAIKEKYTKLFNAYQNKYLAACCVMNKTYALVDDWTEQYPELVQAIKDKDKYLRLMEKVRKEAEQYGVYL